MSAAWADPDRLDCGPALSITELQEKQTIVADALADELTGMAETGEITDRPIADIADTLATIAVATLIT
jgi:hypothetical protein